MSFLRLLNSLESPVTGKSPVLLNDSIAFDNSARARSRSLSIDLMNEKLDKNDWDNLVRGFYALKKEMVKMMIDMFINPDDYHVDEMNPTTIKDLLISRVNRQR